MANNKKQPHNQTEKLFTGLIAQAESKDTKLLLRGLLRIGILIEEVSRGVAVMDNDSCVILETVSENVDTIKDLLAAQCDQEAK